jgi:hypothetical protein
MKNSRKIRTGSLYVFHPVIWDKIQPCYGYANGYITEGSIVRVIQPRGCPKNGTMGHCYIETRETPAVFCGLVCCNSLQPYKGK